MLGGITEMRITKIKLYELRVPLKHPYILSKEYGVQAETTPIVAEIHTDSGLIGYSLATVMKQLPWR